MNRICALISLCALCLLICKCVETTECDHACHEPQTKKIQVHLIPHTHDDVGWLKTVDQYFYGSNKGHSPVGVQYILDSVTSELEKNAARRFVYVETAYFWAWWDELDNNGRETVKNLINQGRLEFLHGGWCMSDEATPHYSAMIDQMTLGLKFLNDTFGKCGRPTASWQIDPFGHSSEVAIEFAEMGFDGLFVGRIDYEDHLARKSAKTMEMVWRPDPSLGEAGELFTSVLFDLYTAPAGFCFDIFCSDEPIMDNVKLHGYNVDEKVKKFEEILKRYVDVYKSRNLLVTMGNDFTYSVASSWFKNIDKLIKYTNNRSDTFELLYSTPSCYLQAVNSQNLTWPVKENDDFFPYASDEHSFWSGYFTSRPSFKFMAYFANNVLQVTKQMATILDQDLADEEFYFKRAVAIAQHHDGVSGTEKQHVVDDYAQYLYEGLEDGKKIITRVYKELYDPDYPGQQCFCYLRNISQCSVSEDIQNYAITIYNPMSRKISVPIKVPIFNNIRHRVYQQNGAEVETDFVPIPEPVTKAPGRHSNTTHDLIFVAKDIPALGLVNYYVEVSKAENKNTDRLVKPTTDDTVILDNGIIKLVFNKTNGLLKSVTKNGTEWPLHQNFYFYNATKGYNYNAESRASGAYIFRPTNTGDPEPVSTTANLTEYHGNNVFEVRQQFSSWVSQVVRLYKNSSDIEFEWFIDSIPIVDWTGVEVVTKYFTDVASNNTFYTDSNGRRWMKRIRDHRKYWNLTLATEPVSRNYYPVTTSICVRDSKKQVTVITDRPEGGTSMHSGEIEIMLHRRLLYDDNKGVVEPLDEIAYSKGLAVRGKHTLQINDIASADAAHRFKVVQSQYGPISTVAKTEFLLNNWITNYSKNFSLLVTDLPPNVHILTLERWRKDQVLLRLEHLFQADETPEYAQSVNVNIKDLFAFYKVIKVQELSLAANWEKDKLKRLKWLAQGQNSKVADVKETNSTTLQPMQIKTFLLYIDKKTRSK